MAKSAFSPNQLSNHSLRLHLNLTKTCTMLKKKEGAGRVPLFLLLHFPAAEMRRLLRFLPGSTNSQGGKGPSERATRSENLPPFPPGFSGSSSSSFEPPFFFPFPFTTYCMYVGRRTRTQPSRAKPYSITSLSKAERLAPLFKGTGCAKNRWS